MRVVNDNRFAKFPPGLFVLIVVGLALVMLFASRPAVWATPGQAPDRQSIPPEITIFKGVVPTDTVCPGQTIMYTLAFSNSFKISATNVFITDTLSPAAGLTNVEVISRGVTLTDTGPLSWRVADLARGQGGIITITGQVATDYAWTLTDTAILTNTALITSANVFTPTGAITTAGDTSVVTITVGPCLSHLPLVAKYALSCGFFDDFHNPDSGWWPRGKSGDDIVEWGYADGEYQILIKDRNRWQEITTLITTTSSPTFALEVDAGYATANLGSGQGLVFEDGSDGFYMFVVRSETQQYSIWKYYKATQTWFALRDWASSPAVNAGQTQNYLKVVRKGSRIDVYANGQFLSTVDDGEFSGDRGVGLIAATFPTRGAVPVHFRFDNFSLKPPECMTEAPWSGSGADHVPSSGGQRAGKPFAD